MPNAVETIGSGETYTTIQAWEDALTSEHFHQGECKAEVFATTSFSGPTVYDSTNYAHLTTQSGAEHDGRAPSDSTVYLQIYDRNTPAWETLDSDNTTGADTDFDLTGEVSANLDDYYDADFEIACRVYQEAS